jgi:uncharacterized membrane protein (DUF2068 family)
MQGIAAMIDAPPALPPKARRRPFGLWAIITIQLLTMLGSGLVLLVLGATVVFAEQLVTAEGIDPSIFDLNLSLFDVASFVLAFVVNAICAFGLWRRKRWAWFFTMLQLGFFMLTDLYSYFTNSPPPTYAWSMLFNVSMVFYLNQREVQAIFLSKEER